MHFHLYTTAYFIPGLGISESRRDAIPLPLVCVTWLEESVIAGNFLPWSHVRFLFTVTGQRNGRVLRTCRFSVIPLHLSMELPRSRMNLKPPDKVSKRTGIRDTVATPGFRTWCVPHLGPYGQKFLSKSKQGSRGAGDGTEPDAQASGGIGTPPTSHTFD